MQNIIFFDDRNIENLYPITLTRPSCKIRIGITTIEEKWHFEFQQASFSYLTKKYLNKLFPTQIEHTNLLINGAYLPNYDVVKKIKLLEPNQALIQKGEIVAAVLSEKKIKELKTRENILNFSFNEINQIGIQKIEFLHNVFTYNDQWLTSDFKVFLKNRTSQKICETNTIIGPKENIFLEEGAVVKACIINVEDSYLYVGKNAYIMEGCMIRNGLAMGNNSVLKMGAKIYGATTIGPFCKVGGEVNNSVFFSYSNKAHDGFIGNSVIAEWCNLGADTNNSNLKNNYSEVSLYNYKTQKFVPTGLQFCGLIIGDYSKTGINTMFNTGTIVSVSSNLFDSGFPPKWVPAFRWGNKKQEFYDFTKAIHTIEKVMQRRNIILSPKMVDILQNIQKTENDL